MSATLTDPTRSVTTNNVATNTVTRTRSLVATGAAAALLASVATATVAATGHAAGISLDMSGEPIPVGGFATLTLVFSVLGLAIAVALKRFAARPRSTWVRATVVLTALSVVPDALADVSASTRALLITTHLVAAAIVVPAVARRLPA